MCPHPPKNKGESTLDIRLQLSVGLEPPDSTGHFVNITKRCGTSNDILFSGDLAGLTRQWRREIGSAGVAFRSRVDPSPETQTKVNDHTHTHTRTM